MKIGIPSGNRRTLTLTPVSFSLTILFRMGGTTKQNDSTVNSGN
jgi:hypothetical protein